MFNFQRQNSTIHTDTNSVYDRVIFENIADQYPKGEDVTVYVTLPQNLETNSDEDQIGLIRIGSTSIKQCLICVPVQFQTSTSTDLMIHGTATFPAANLPVTDDEFYQFWYIRNQSKSLGSSLPFQLNCTLDDLDFLSDISQKKDKVDSLASLSDQETDDVVVINSKGKSYVNESSENARRCQELETMNVKHLEEITRMRSQLNTMTQFTVDQASKIVDYERRLIQTEQLLKKSNEEKLVFEQRLRDLELTSEKYQRSTQAEIQHLSSTTADQQLRDLRLTFEKQQRSMNDQLKSYAEHIAQRDKRISQLEEANQLLHAKFSRVPNIRDEINDDNVLKRQLIIYQKFIDDLQQETKCLSKRLSSECRPQTNHNTSDQSLINTDQVQYCPVCNVQFPKGCSLNQKNEHIEHHFQ